MISPILITVLFNGSHSLSTYTGANTLYGGVSQYASGFNYRAWGGIKALTYGNNYSLAVSYNSRLQGTQFEVAGQPPQFGASTVMKTQYQYFADGSLKFADDLLDQRFDRAFSYDHTGLVKEAYSGGEARDYVNGTSGSGATGPYRQSYQFDVFGHLTSRVNRFWSHNDSFTAVYTNNRRQGFQYDADGRLKQDDDLQYHYDAAGHSIAVFDADINKWLSYFRDGDGQLIKRVETIFNPIATTYYVRSTVLGGRVITELNQNGQKQKGYVFAGAQLLAEQENNVVNWKYTNPLTGSSGSASTNGQFNGEAELDPLGVNIGFGNPFDGSFEGLSPEPFLPALVGDESSCGSNPNCTRCTLDGMEIGCDRVGHLMDIGAVDLEVTFTNGDRETVPLQGHGAGVITVWIPGQAINIDHGRDADTLIFDVDETHGHWEFYTFNFAPQNGDRHRHHPEPPQNPGQVLPPSKPISDLVRDRLKNPKCAEYVQKLLDKANELFGQGYPHAKSMDELLRKIDGAGGFQLDGAVYHTVSGDLFANGALPATVHIIPFMTPGAPNRYHLAQRDDYYARAGIHEPFHLARQGGYSDEQMARTAYALAGKALPNVKRTGDLTEAYTWSGLWDRELQKHCPPVGK